MCRYIRSRIWETRFLSKFNDWTRRGFDKLRKNTVRTLNTLIDKESNRVEFFIILICVFLILGKKFVNVGTLYDVAYA